MSQPPEPKGLYLVHVTAGELAALQAIRAHEAAHWDGPPPEHPTSQKEGV
jgi:hypothetical protein